MDSVWPAKTGSYSYSKQAVLGRAQHALVELYKRKEKVIAVVSHGHFLRTAVANKEFYNADMRIFVMKKSQDNHIFLVERTRTLENGGYLHRHNSTHRSIEMTDFPTDVQLDSSLLMALSAAALTPRSYLSSNHFLQSDAKQESSKAAGNTNSLSEMKLDHDQDESRPNHGLGLSNDIAKSINVVGQASASSVVSLRWPYGEFRWPDSTETEMNVA
jgi:hypothetical protein